MKNAFTFFLTIAIVKFTLAQSISLNHQFYGTSFSNISKGNNKVGFVTFDTIAGAPYIVNYMDSFQNIVSVIDTNIAYPSYGTLSVAGPTDGDALLVTEMDPSGHLWGLFYDFRYGVSRYIIGNPNYQICLQPYFLYDFDNHQKHFLDLGSLICGNPQLTPYERSNNSINFLNDTTYITFQLEDSFIPTQYSLIVRWSNGNMISAGKIPGAYPETIIAHDSKLSFLTSQISYQTLGIDTNNNQIGYDQDLTISNTILQNMTAATYDGCASNGNTYLIGFAYDFWGPNPSFEYLAIKNNSLDTVIKIPISGFLEYAAVMVDHADRVWVFAFDSIVMYDGAGWQSFSMQGLNTVRNNQQLSTYPWEITIIEYAHNRFMINTCKKGWPNSNVYEIGNGIIFFDYNEVATKIENKGVENIVKVAPNPAQEFIYILDKNNQNQTATVYDAVGKVILKSVLNSNLSIDISSLSKGIYFLEVARQRVKFVKE